jgi:hypothetical protein
VKQAFRDEKFDRAIMNELGEMGFWGDDSENTAAPAWAMWLTGCGAGSGA